MYVTVHQYIAIAMPFTGVNITVFAQRRVVLCCVVFTASEEE